MSKKQKSKRKAPRRVVERRPKRWVLLCGIFFIVALGASVAVFMMQSGEKKSESIVSHVEDARQLYEQERFAEAYEVLHDVRQFLKDDPEALKLYGKICLQLPAEGNSHVSTSIAVFRRGLKLNPDDPELLDFLADLYQRTGASESAVEFAEQAIVANPEKKTKYLRIIATESLNDRKFDRAIEAADQWIGLSENQTRAYEIRLAAMMGKGDSAEDVSAWIRQASAEMQKVAFLLQANMENDRAAAMANIDQLVKNPPKDDQQLSYVVAKLDQAGRRNDAIQLIENQVNTSSDSTLEKELIFRYWQRGELEKMTNRLAASSQELSDEYQILHCLGLIYQNRIDDAKIEIEKLNSKSSRLARLWKDVLVHSVGDIDSGQELLAACDRALQSFPSLAYLVNHRALACEMVGEQDLAIATYEKAVRMAPRWYAPRVALARLNYARGNYRAAFEAASSTLKINSEQPAMVELATSAALEWAASDEPIPKAMQSEIKTTLDKLVTHSKNGTTRSLIQVARSRVEGNRPQADRQIREIMQETGTLSLQQIRLLLRMADQADLRQSLSDQLARIQRKNAFQLISSAREISSSDGIEKALTYLEDYEFNGEKPPKLVVDVAKAELLTSSGDSRAKQAWIKLAMENPSNSKVVDLVLASPVLRDDQVARQKIVDQLKQATNGKGVIWRLEQARQLLAKNEKKKAAEAALILTKLIEETPKFGDAYYLLAASHDQLGNPNKSIQVLQSAVAAGIDEPWLYIDLAERFGSAEQKSETIHFANSAGTDRRATREIRQRAVNLLLKFDACGQVVALVEKDLPSDLTDSDEDFTLASVYAVAAGKIGSHDKAEKRIWPMTNTSERWLNLWIDVAILPSNRESLSVEWLKRAENRIGDSDDLRRNLAIAWGKLAQQSNHPELAENGCRLIEPLAQTSSRDQILQALLFQRAGNRQQAIACYEAMLKTNSGSPLLMNNLGVLLSSDPKTAERGEALVKQALESQARHEFVDSLAKVYLKQQRRGDAIKVISEYRERFADQPGLGIQLAELQFEEGQHETALKTLTEVETRESAKVNMTLEHWNRINDLKSRIRSEEISRTESGN